MNLVKMQIPLNGYAGFLRFVKFCVATIGVCVFRCAWLRLCTLFVFNPTTFVGDGALDIPLMQTIINTKNKLFKENKMKKKIKLTPILLALILSLGASLTSCEDSEAGTDSSSITVSQTEKETNADTAAKTDSVTSEAPTDSVITETPAEDTEAPETTVSETEPTITKAPETQAPETKPPVTTAPEAQAPVDEKVYADPEKYPDNWGKNVIDLPIRTDGKNFFWKKSRVMHAIPKGAPPVEEWCGIFSDEKNDQMIFFTGGTYTYYAVVEGNFYKLSEGKIVSWSQHSGFNQLWWIEESGIAKSVNVRSSKYNEVYKEADGVKGYNSKRPYTYFKFDDSIISPIKENVLLEVKKIK